MILNKEQIMEIIPHRDPFLLIDEVTELDVGKSIRAIKYVRPEEYYFEGHFPQEKVMPGVLIIEAMAQAGAVAILSMEEHKNKIAYFGGIPALSLALLRQSCFHCSSLSVAAAFSSLRSYQPPNPSVNTDAATPRRSACCSQEASRRSPRLATHSRAARLA